MLPSSEASDTLQISIKDERDIAANAAELSVTVKGASLLTGQMALHKAREVAQLVSDLAGVGIGQEDIFLQSVSANIANGTLIKMSGAYYRLRIHVEPLEKLADVLGIITSQKNAVLHGIAWQYPKDAADRDTWLTACVA